MADSGYKAGEWATDVLIEFEKLAQCDTTARAFVLRVRAGGASITFEHMISPW